MTRLSISRNGVLVELELTSEQAKAHNDRVAADKAESTAHEARPKLKSITERLATLEAEVTALKAAAQTRLR